jgi:hypothetical protein
MADKPLPPIVTQAARHLVVPMPRAGLATFRIDGHLMRVRKCPRCSLNTTIPVCPLCETETITSTPDESALNRSDTRTASITRGRRPERIASSPRQCPRCKRGSLAPEGPVERCSKCDYTEPACPNCGTLATHVEGGAVKCNGCDGVRSLSTGANP